MVACFALVQIKGKASKIRAEHFQPSATRSFRIGQSFEKIGCSCPCGESCTLIGDRISGYVRNTHPEARTKDSDHYRAQ